MEEIRFCSFCGKSLDKLYNYCPHCGTQCRDVPVFEELVDDSFEKLEKIHMKTELQRLKQLEGVLLELEEELNHFLSVKSV